MPALHMRRVLSALACSAALGGALLGAAEQSPASAGVTARLEFREQTEGAEGLWLSADSTREVAFRKEPQYARGPVRRGILSVGPEPGDVIGFAWEPRARTLHLDLDRDLDLTNDPGGAIRGHPLYGEGQALEAQQFSGIRLELERDGIARSYFLSATLFDHTDGSNFSVRSGWAGTVRLGDQEHRIELQDNLDGAIGSGDRLWVGSDPGSPGGHTFYHPRCLLLGGDPYRVRAQFEPEGRVGAVALTLERAETAIGTLDLAGSGFEELVLEGACAAVLRPPQEQVRLPEGTYIAREVRSEFGLSAVMFGGPVSFDIRPGETTRLAIGDPLRPAVETQARGRTLVLDCQLLGQGGEQYSGRELGHAPELEIRSSDRVLLRDSFEFG